MLRIFSLLIFLFSLIFANNTVHYKVSYDPDYAPYSYDIDNNPNGLLIDIFKAWGKVNNVEVEFVNGKNWDNAINLAKIGKVDFFLGTEPYEKWMKGSIPYYKTKTTLFSLKSFNNPLQKIGIIGVDFKDDLLKEFKNIEIISYSTYEELLLALIEQKVDAIYEDEIGLYQYALKQNKNHLIKKIESLSHTQNMCAISNNIKTIEFFNKGFLKLDPKSLSDIENLWITNESLKHFNASKKDLFTLQEKKWLSSKPNLNFAVDPKWQPIEYINEKTKIYEGMNADLLHLISKLTGITFTLIPTKDWSESVELSKNKKVDMLACVSKTDEREEYLNFSHQTFQLTDGIITRHDAIFIDEIDDLKGLKIGVPEGTALHKMLQKNHPLLIIVPINGTEKALEMLSNKEIYAYAGNLEVSGFLLQQLGLYNLKVIWKFEEKRSMYIALQKNIPPEAISIINKALASISNNEIETIKQRWIGLKVTENTDYELFIKIGAGFLLLTMVIGYYNRKLKTMVDEKTADLLKQKEELAEFNKNLEELIQSRTKELEDEKKFVNSVMNSQNSIVVSTDGIQLKTVNKAFLKFFEVDTISDFSTKFGKCICNTFDKNSSDDYIKENMYGKNWIEYIYQKPNQIHKTKIILHDKMHIFTITVDRFEFNGQELVTAVLSDITELEKTREEVEKILSNILLPVLITSRSKRTILYANKYAEQQYEMTLDKIVGSEIDNVYTLLGQKDDILNAIKKDGYVANMEQKFKTNSGKTFDALLSVTPIVYRDEPSFIGMITDITKQKELEQEIRQMHKHTRESIEYASLIQTSLIPDNTIFRKYFNDYFVLWHPKDIVGGDIYFCEELKEKDECLLMVIDCTGHGVPGAFVTMLVKAIERQIVSKINHNENEIVSPSEILSIFNQNIKYLLKQEEKESVSNAGFDGQIVYYNKKEKIIKCASARNSIFYVQDDEVIEIKGDRHSIGYKESNLDFQFIEHTINVTKETTIYLSTDGYWDQMGGESERSFGKKRFKALIENIKNEPMAEQQEEFIYTLRDYQGDVDRQDDITVIAFKIKETSDILGTNCE